MKLLGLPLLALTLSSTVGAAALHYREVDDVAFSASTPLAEFGVDLELTWRQAKVPLRALPLGASTVWGIASEPHDGRRDGYVGDPKEEDTFSDIIVNYFGYLR
ncbi:hypothetical protein QSH57_006857 [Fusarium oxysporum f. sp. vasinfectum]|nr:hypothetical protein QSH57_006857 [Fusarium oxysporum f. sp. vasinfectum]